MIELVTRLWEILSPVHSQILSLIFTLVGAMIFWLFRARVKLIWGRSNNSIHFIQADDKKTEIYCEKYFLQNAGRKPANDVQFVMSFKPDDFSVFPARNYEQLVNPEGQFVTRFPFIAPRELVVIDVVYIQKRAAVIESVICSEVIGKNVAFITNRKFGMTFNIMVSLLLFFGAAFILQTVLNLVLGS
ncbi:hypothetical protein [Ciceribacter sp. T2.26MG-112.2]|uniref:hypothetical protein n=1 Tax=Ciceribacter sp. T2.26MG-112.2 TaxID=3137154 RepID=UPI0012B69AAC|nr:hypothetical protein [Ciceribacter naphthalenivorans]